MIAPEDRDRIDDRARRPAASPGRTSIVGRIVDGGHMPAADDDGNVVYLLESVSVKFREESGADATIDARTGRFAAVRIGGRGTAGTKAGDVVTCHPVGDRWAFTVGGAPRKGVNVWVLSRATIEGFRAGVSPPTWVADRFVAGAGDGSRFKVFAYWRYDIDTGVLVPTTLPITPSSIPSKQHILHENMDDSTPSRVDHPWGHLVIPVDPAGVHANNLTPNLGTIRVVIVDTDGDPDWQLIASIPPYRTDLSGKRVDVNMVYTWQMPAGEYTVADQLTWNCPALHPRPSPPDTPFPSVDHSFEGAEDVTVDYHVNMNIGPATLDVVKTTAPAYGNGYWYWPAPSWAGGVFAAPSDLDTVTNASLGTIAAALTGFLGTPEVVIRTVRYEVHSPSYTPTYTNIVAVGSASPTVSITLCKQSYGYVSVPRGAAPPFSAPGCVPPVVRVTIEATGIRANANPPPAGSPPIPATVDLKRFFGDYAGAAATCPVRATSAGPFAPFGTWSSDPVFNRSLGTAGRWSQLNVRDTGFLIRSADAGGDVYSFASDPTVTGAGGTVVGGSTFFVMFPPCGGARPTGGTIEFSYQYGIIGTTPLGARYVIGSWDIS
jgi:hypothetical protein